VLVALRVLVERQGPVSRVLRDLQVLVALRALEELRVLVELQGLA
jgi:hypothetical protein